MASKLQQMLAIVKQLLLKTTELQETARFL